MSGYGESLSSVTPDILRVNCKNKRKKTSDTLFTGKETIQEPFNPRKKAKEITLTDIEKGIPKEKPPLILHKVDYEGDTNEKTHGYDSSTSETDGCVRNLAKEHENEEDE